MALLDLFSVRPVRSGFSLVQFARTVWAVRRQRLALARLDDAALADVGLTRAQVKRELDKPIWDVPATWTS